MAEENEVPVEAAAGGEEMPPLDQPLEDYESPQQIEKRKTPYPVFWNRPKARMYRMNYDYGENYYSNMVSFLNNRAHGTYRDSIPPPKAQSWAERALKSAPLRYPRREADLSNMLATVRSNIRDYDLHHRQSTSRVQSVYGGVKAY